MIVTLAFNGSSEFKRIMILEIILMISREVEGN